MIQEFNEEAIIQKMIGYGLPDYMQEGVLNYLSFGILPGDFLHAVLCNDLFRAVAKSDNNNIRLLKEWVSFIYNVFPSIAWGSPEAVRNWLEISNQKENQENE